MDAELLMKTATLAGELMLKSGAETYRVEDTMGRILKKADNLEISDVLVIMTGISATLKIKDHDVITVMIRVKDISTNLNLIARVNEISRQFCSGEINLEEAYKYLTRLKPGLYSQFQYNVGYVAIGVGFVLFFGGNWVDVLAATIVGMFFNIIFDALEDTKYHAFIKHVILSVGIAFMSMTLEGILKDMMDLDTVIISCLMSLVPGMAITNAVRDTLRGDYLSGTARVLEAFLKAAGIALGIGLGIALFGKLI